MSTLHMDGDTFQEKKGTITDSKQEVKHFKNQLSDYYYLKSKLARIEDMQIELEAKRGVKAIQYDKEYTSGSIDPLVAELKRLDDTEKADFLDKEWIKYSNKLDWIENFLKSSEIGTSIKKIHCLGESSYEKEARRLYMGVMTLKRKVNREIVKYLANEY